MRATRILELNIEFKCCKKSSAPAICNPNTAECKVKCSKHIQCGKHSLCFSAIQYKAENREPRLTERGNVVVWAFSTCVKANHRTEPDKVCKVTNPRFNDCECVGHKCNRIVHLSGTHVPERPADLIDSFADGQLGQGQDLIMIYAMLNWERVLCRCITVSITLSKSLKFKSFVTGVITWALRVPWDLLIVRKRWDFAI